MRRRPAPLPPARCLVLVDARGLAELLASADISQLILGPQLRDLDLLWKGAEGGAR